MSIQLEMSYSLFQLFCTLNIQILVTKIRYFSMVDSLWETGFGIFSSLLMTLYYQKDTLRKWTGYYSEKQPTNQPKEKEN